MTKLEQAPARQTDDLAQEIAQYHSLREAVMRKTMVASGLDPDIFITKSMPQSQMFMVEIIPWIHKLYMHEPANIVKTILDVGPQTFSGTALLSSLHTKESFNNLKLEVSAIDIHDKFDNIRKVVCPEVELVISDIFTLKDRVWDAVICSHVIEHVDDPLQFMHRLQQIARDFVIVACPWSEDPIETKGHRNSIKKDLVRRAGGRDLQIFTNYMWGKRREVCIFWLPGLAGSSSPVAA
jgi:hypothetical protein